MKLTTLLVLVAISFIAYTTSCTHPKIEYRTITKDSVVIDSIFSLPDTQVVIKWSDSSLSWSKEVWPLDSSFSASILKFGTRRYLRILYPHLVPQYDNSGADILSIFEIITPSMGWQSIYDENIYDRTTGKAGLTPIYTQKPHDTVMVQFTRLIGSKGEQITEVFFWVDTSTNIYRIQY